MTDDDGRIAKFALANSAGDNTLANFRSAYSLFSPGLICPEADAPRTTTMIDVAIKSSGRFRRLLQCDFRDLLVGCCRLLKAQILLQPGRTES
jgi:hypothetical protein